MSEQLSVLQMGVFMQKTKNIDTWGIGRVS